MLRASPLLRRAAEARGAGVGARGWDGALRRRGTAAAEAKPLLGSYFHSPTLSPQLVGLAGSATAWSCRPQPPSTGTTSAVKPETATSASLVRAPQSSPLLVPAGPLQVRGDPGHRPGECLSARGLWLLRPPRPREEREAQYLTARPRGRETGMPAWPGISPTSLSSCHQSCKLGICWGHQCSLIP